MYSYSSDKVTIVCYDRVYKYFQIIRLSQSFMGYNQIQFRRLPLISGKKNGTQIPQKGNHYYGVNGHISVFHSRKSLWKGRAKIS